MAVRSKWHSFDFFELKFDSIVILFQESIVTPAGSFEILTFKVKFCSSANASTHASRYFNHDEHGTLNFTVSYDEQRVEFFAARAIAPGEELTFDYGVGFWMASRSVPLAGTDSRSFELRAETADEKPRGPPPPVPMTVSQLDALDAAPVSERRLAMLRCLDYLGAERGDAGELLVPTSLGGTAEVVVDASGESLAQLHTACRSLLALLEARSAISLSPHS